MNSYSYKIVVTKDDIDINLHVNNIMYVKWMQEAAMEHSKAVGDTFEVQSERGYMWVIKSHNIEYFHPAYENDEIEITTYTKKYRKSASFRIYNFTNQKGETLAKAKSIFVCLNSSSLRPIKIPEDIDSLYY